VERGNWAFFYVDIGSVQRCTHIHGGSALGSFLGWWLPCQRTALQYARTATQYASGSWRNGPP
jgi:hypothetical protein